jgi:hypothetical protein
MLTISAIKADVGSIGGHTHPSQAMLQIAQERLQEARESQVITDFAIRFTGGDLCLLMIHRKGNNNAEIHNLAWEIFRQAAGIARQQGLGYTAPVRTCSKMRHPATCEAQAQALPRLRSTKQPRNVRRSLSWSSPRINVAPAPTIFLSGLSLPAPCTTEA